MRQSSKLYRICTITGHGSGTLLARFSRCSSFICRAVLTSFVYKIISIDFRETIDLVGMILSKTDFSISRMYDEGKKSFVLSVNYPFHKT